VTARRKVLIIDDDKAWQAFLAAAFQDDYDVLAALDGDIGLKLAQEWLPDTILLDIEMPVKNGYQVCTALKTDLKLRDIPVIFVSSASRLQEKIIAFKLGADDYIVKPCESELLRAKIARSETLYREKRELGEKATGAEVLAFEAMSSSADLGRSVRFAERTYALHSFDKLAEGLFQTMEEFGLDTSVMFITRSGPQFYVQNKYEMSPLERDMFQAIHHEGRFCDFGNRTFCNFERVSLLIKNMPEANPERYGRIKDTVPWILGVVDGKVGALDVQNTLLAQQDHVADTIKQLRDLLGNSTQQLEHSQESALGSAAKADLHNNLIAALALLTNLEAEQARVKEIVDNHLGDPQATEPATALSNDIDFF